MKSIYILLAIGLFISCKKEKPVEVTMKDDVVLLASDSLHGRQTGTSYEILAADYIANRFKNLGLEPKGVKGYFQEFSFKDKSDPHGNVNYVSKSEDSTTTGTNVIAYLNNNAENTVVIGAHYDHLGMGIEGSLYRGDTPQIHNGADDNASGVAAMLHLAKQLKTINTNNNYLFIAFSGEEMGLLGSNYFVKNPTIDLKKVDYMLNMDMVGRLNDEKAIAVHGVGTSPIFKQVLFSNKGDFKIAEHESGVGPSDHTSFYLMDIPVLHFFTGQHEDYHKPSDDADKLNYEGMEEITQFILSIITELNDDGKIAFRKTKNESQEVPAFKVTLGVVPDYLFSGKGMRIDGVSEDKPAQKAGMQKGDIVVKMGDYGVEDMMSYMKSLGKFEKGSTTKVSVKRGDEILVLDVTF
ncbi:M20/M25/M40 family metallo-hydrolase [Yeosuana marina]|uniref:M20/M25/M40 family metallo-hydrolase n=1 Tax=Yeosuana marina TaxID=1565536 RepID=UPI001420A443|nr:M20/M25/M40 family metallo-hydrolase [Yeosuana marina]